MLKVYTHAFFIAVLCLGFKVNAQDTAYFDNSIKNLNENTYYIKPEITFWPSKSDVQATSNQFSTYGSYLTMIYGFLGGYQSKHVSVESGLRFFSIKTGFSMALTGNDFIFHKASNNSQFVQVPVAIKLSIWQPSSKSVIYGLACVAYTINLDNNGVITPAIFTVRPSTISPSGQVITYNVARTFQSMQNFISGELGIGFRWWIYRRTGMDLQVKRLFSATNINQLDATVSQLGDPTVDHIHSQNGTNGIGISVGLIYKIRSL
jgi:hypothetical protein